MDVTWQVTKLYLAVMLREDEEMTQPNRDGRVFFEKKSWQSISLPVWQKYLNVEVILISEFVI